MTKYFWVLLLAYGVSASAGQERSGAAGIRMNGNLLTPAQLIAGSETEAIEATLLGLEEEKMLFLKDLEAVESVALSYEQLPELAALIGIVQQVVEHGGKNLSQALSYLNIQENLRSYVYESKVDVREQEAVVGVYRSLYENGTPAKDVNGARDIELFALTDSLSNETALLDGYFKVESLEARMALLYHEMLWALNPTLSYSFVVEAEYRFYEFLVARRRLIESGISPSVLNISPQIVWDISQALAGQQFLQ